MKLDFVSSNVCVCVFVFGVGVTYKVESKQKSAERRSSIG